MIGDFLHDWVLPILSVVLTVAAILSVVYFVVYSIIAYNRANPYCYSLSLPDVKCNTDGSCYCSGLKDGNTIVIPVPDSVLRKE